MAGQERDGPVKGRPAGPTGPVSVPRKPRRRPSADPAKNPLAQGPPAPTRTTRVPRTTYPASSGMGAGTRAASAPYRPPPPPPRSTPQRTDRDAVVWAAKNSPAVAVHTLVPQAKPPTLPSVAPYRRGQGPVPVRVSRPVTYVERGHPAHVLGRGVERTTVYVPRPKAATRNQQYRWALDSQTHPESAKKLADSMTPQERYRVLHPPAPERHKHFWQSLWDAYQHQVSAFTGGLSAAGSGRSLSQEELQAALLPKTIGQGGATVAGLAAVSLAQRAAAAYQKQVAGYTGGLRAAGTGRPLSQEQLQAGLLPETLGVGVYKQGLATVGAAAAFRHPIGALQGIWREGGAMAAGNTQMAGLIAAMSTGQMSTREMKKIVDDLVDSTLQDLNRRVGPNTSLRQVYNIGRNEPFMTTLNTLAALSGSTKLLAFGSELAKGESVGGAFARIRAARQAVRVPAEPRRFTISEASYAARQAHHAEAPGGLTVETHWSENPVTRARQRGYDAISRKAEEAGLGRIPVVRRITESSRGARKLRGQQARAGRRETAKIHTFMRDIQAGTKGDPVLETRLALLQMKPKGLTDDEFIQAAASDIRQMLEGREFSAPEQMTAAQRQLLNTARSYERRAALARDARRHRAMRNMGREQTRLSQTLERVQRNRADLHDEYLTIETSGLSAAQKAQARDELAVEIEQQDGFAQVLKQELDDLSVDQPPVEHPARDQARTVLNRLPWYRQQIARGASRHIDEVGKAERKVATANQRLNDADTPFQRGRAEKDLTRAQDELDALHRRGPANAVDDSIALADTRARVWARQNPGRSPGEWWAGRDIRHVAPEEIQAAVLRQGDRVEGVAEQRPAVAGVHAQTRGHDILGASEWLGGPDGQRIISLTEQADASTVMREMFGHAGDEMKTFHPQEFAKVEQEMGVPYEQWGTTEHGRFATWAERYFKDGLAPTPELVPIFDRMKAWMRTIYDGMTRMLGPRIPLETKTLFDAYFGAFDDENALRVAASMHRAPLMSADESHLNGASVMAKQRLATAQKRSASLKEKRSLDGMLDRLKTMKEKDEWTDADAVEYSKLYGEALAKAADEATRQDVRERQLRVKLADINKGLANPPDSPRFEGARHAMRDMSDYREQVLRDVFGPDYDAAFAQRVDLLPDWLHHQGLLKGDYEPGSAGYFPHRVSGGTMKRIAAPAVSLVHRVRGRVDSSGLGLHKQNQMILWQNGDWSADPHVLMEAAIRASGYAHSKEVVDSLWNMGRPLTREEEHQLVDLPADAYIINPNGTPISPHLRAGLDRKTTTLNAHRVLEGVDGGSNESLEASIHDYIENTILDGDKLPKDFNPGTVPGLRVVSKSLVHQILRPLEGSGGAPGQVLDFASTLARWSLIYANVPGYAIANSLGNTGFLIAQQGWLVPFEAVRAFRQLYGNGKLIDAVDAEIGELPAFAAVSRGREFSETAKELEARALRRISVVDRVPRRAAWMYEAKKAGYRTAEDKLRLTAGETPKTLLDRERVASLTAEHMVNFDRLSPFERSRVTRFLFVYPWIRAATAWPFWYAAQYPERVALAGMLALPLEQRRKELLGGLTPPKGLSAEGKRKWFAKQRPLIPPWYEGLVPLRTRGTAGHLRADVLNATSIGPAATAQQSLETIYDTFASLLGQKPTPLTNRLLDSVMPFLRDTAAATTLSSPSGQAQSLREVLSGMFTDVIPGPRFYEALANPGSPTIWPLGTPTGAPKIFTQDDPLIRAEHMFLRLAPAEISIARLNAQAALAHTPTAAEQLQIEIDASKHAWQKAEPGLPVDQAVTRGAKITVLYRQAVKEMQAKKKADRQWDPKPLVSGAYQKLPDLSSYEQARLAYKVVKQVYPGLDQNDLPAPDRYLRDEGLNPSSVEGKIALDKYHSKVLSVFTKATKKVKNVAKKVDLEKALEREQASAG